MHPFSDGNSLAPQVHGNSVTEQFFIAQVNGLGGVGEAGYTFVDLLEFPSDLGDDPGPGHYVRRFPGLFDLLAVKVDDAQNEPVRLMPGLVGLCRGQTDIPGLSWPLPPGNSSQPRR